MFIQVFTSVDRYVLLNINHIVSIDYYGSGSLITLSTKETVESTDAPQVILQYIQNLS